MSEVKVNKVSPRSGTTVTIGDSGDTINLVGTLQNNGSPLTGDISSVVAGTGLSGGATSGVATLNIEAAQPTITSLGTIATFRSTGIDDNATSTAITIDSSENIGIGTTSPVSLGSNITTLEITGGSTIRTGAVYLSSSDKNIKGYFYGSNTGFNIGTQSNADLKVVTNNTERVRIHSDGVMSAVNGVALGVGTANTASNVLDDYEEGTFTPAWSFSGGGSVAYSNQVGRYTKIGRTVTINLYINTSSISSPSGNASITGLPFTNDQETGCAIGILYRWNTDFDADLTFLVNQSGSTISAYKQASTAEAAALQGSDFLDGSSKNIINLSATYQTT